MPISNKIIPLSLFKKSTEKYLDELKNSAGPLVVTLHGRGAFVVQTIEVYSLIEQWAEYAQARTPQSESKWEGHDSPSDT